MVAAGNARNAMKILVTGSAGMIGRKLVERLVKDQSLGGKPIEALTLVDVVDSPIPEGAPKDTRPIVADFSEKGVAHTLIQDRPDVIFHLAAIVSGDAEASISMAAGRCWKRSAKKETSKARSPPTSRALFSPRPWRSSARPSRIRFRMTLRPRPAPAMAPRRR